MDINYHFYAGTRERRMPIVKNAQGKIRTTQDNVFGGTITSEVGATIEIGWWTNVGKGMLSMCHTYVCNQVYRVLFELMEYLISP